MKDDKYQIEFFGGPLNRKIEIRSGDIPDIISRKNHCYRKVTEIELGENELLMPYLYDPITSFKMLSLFGEENGSTNKL